MFRLFSLITIGIVLIYTVENAAVERSITGKITFDGPRDLNTNVQVEIALQDVSLMDTLAETIASINISNPKTFPVSYELKYDSSRILPHRSYAISVRITGPDGELLFVNDFQIRVSFADSSSPPVDIAVIRVGRIPDISMTKVAERTVCEPVKCPGDKPKKCEYGFEKQDECEICECSDPCNPPGKSTVCGPEQQCVVDTKSDGTFGTRCDVVPSKNSARSTDGNSSSKDDCSLPKSRGPCRALLRHYYYNSKTKNCELFMYGGCKGNRNNFKTKTQCEALCKA